LRSIVPTGDHREGERVTSQNYSKARHHLGNNSTTSNDSKVHLMAKDHSLDEHNTVQVLSPSTSVQCKPSRTFSAYVRPRNKNISGHPIHHLSADSPSLTWQPTHTQQLRYVSQSPTQQQNQDQQSIPTYTNLSNSSDQQLLLVNESFPTRGSQKSRSTVTAEALTSLIPSYEQPLSLVKESPMSCAGLNRTVMPNYSNELSYLRNGNYNTISDPSSCLNELLSWSYVA
jgi:hypothetical protein